jgi:hypothetical protein
MSTTVTIQPDGTDGIDSFIASNTATTNYGTNATLYIGESNSAASVARALIKFDLSSIPDHAHILSATLSLWNYADAANNARTLRAFRQLRAWTEAGVTWNRYDGSNDWQTAGGFGASDCEQTDCGSLALSATEAAGEKIITLDTAKIQEMVAGAFVNNGFLLKVDTEGDDQYAYRSSDYATAADRPKLTVVYSALLAQATIF